MARGEPSKIKTALSIEGVLEYLDQAQKTDKKAAEKYCDGNCTEDCVSEFKSPDGFWVCLTGNEDKFYCESCYAKLHNGDLDLQYGGNCRSHEFLHLVQDKEKAATLSKGSVLIGDRVIALDDWKKETKAKYVDFEKTV